MSSFFVEPDKQFLFVIVSNYMGFMYKNRWKFENEIKQRSKSLRTADQFYMANNSLCNAPIRLLSGKLR